MGNATAVIGLCALFGGGIEGARRSAEVATTSDTGDAVDGPDGSECAGCVIGESCVAADARNPDNSCEACQPEKSTSAWSLLADDTSCGSGAACATAGVCRAGHCDGAVEPQCSALACVACDDRCDSVIDADTCVIAGACVAEGANPPDDVCRACISGTDPRGWSFTTAACSDGDPCTANDTCAAGKCAGTAMDCDDHIACTLDFCDEGQCVNQIESSFCLIGGACFAAAAGDPESPCQACQPDLDKTSFTLDVGRSCDDGDVCSSFSTCDLEGACVGVPDDLDEEPNDSRLEAQRIGDVAIGEAFPSGGVVANLVPNDVDVFRWAMTFTDSGLFYTPTARIITNAPTALQVCLYARCGDDNQSAAAPKLTCGPGALSSQLDDVTLGCCTTLGALERPKLSLPATCSGGSGPGLAYASVQATNGVDAATCGGYVLSWGAED